MENTKAVFEDLFRTNAFHTENLCGNGRVGIAVTARLLIGGYAQLVVQLEALVQELADASLSFGDVISHHEFSVHSHVVN